MALDSKKKHEIVDGLLNHFFSDKINPKQVLSSLSSTLEDSSLIDEAEKLWEERNKEIEERVYKEFRSASTKDIKQVLNSRKKRFDSSMILAKDISECTENDIKNSLPAEKLLYNQCIFKDRLKGVDITSLNQSMEKRIISQLENETKGLSRQEIVLFYSLIKADKISSAKDEQVKAREDKQQSHFNKALASTFAGLIYPKRVSGQDLREINSGSSIDRETIKDGIEYKIKNLNFSSYPYLILFGMYKNSDIYTKFVNMSALGSKCLGEDIEQIINYTIFYIVFKNADDKCLKSAHIKPNAKSFLDGKSSKPLTDGGAGLVRFLDTFFYALCAQVYEINNTYQKADSSKKIKIYKLYSSEDRLKMIVKNSFSVTEKVIQSMKFDSRKLLDVFEKYLDKQYDFLKKEDIFSDVFDFSKIMI